MNRQEWQAVVGDYRGELKEQIDCSSYGEACELIGDIAQRKLLEYLIEWAKTNPLIMHEWVECHAVHQSRLQSMLKEASQ